MDFSQVFSNENIFRFFFKAFAIFFAFLYLLYAIIVQRQTQVMHATVRSPAGSIILSLSLIQIILGVALVIMAIFFN